MIGLSYLLNFWGKSVIGRGWCHVSDERSELSSKFLRKICDWKRMMSCKWWKVCYLLTSVISCTTFSGDSHGDGVPGRVTVTWLYLRTCSGYSSLIEHPPPMRWQGRCSSQVMCSSWITHTSHLSEPSLAKLMFFALTWMWLVIFIKRLRYFYLI